MTPQELIEQMRHLLLQLNDEHKGAKTAIKTNADLLKEIVDVAEQNLHVIVLQITARLKALEDLIGPD